MRHNRSGCSFVPSKTAPPSFQISAFVAPQFDGARIAKASDPRLFIYSVEKALRILYALNEDRSLSIAEIARKTGFGRSATQRFVYTLEQLRYLRRDPATRRYSLSPRVLDFACSYLVTDPLVSVAVRHLSEAAAKAGEAFALTEMDETDITVIARVPGRHAVGANSAVGMRFPAFCSAPGRAMLAFLPPEEALAVIDRTDLKPLTKRTVTTRSKLVELLEETRRDGYCIAEEEIALDAVSVAAPVFDLAGRPIAAVNAFAPLSRWPRRTAERNLVPVVREAAQELSRAMAAR